MLGNNTMDSAITEVTSIRRRNNVEKSTWRTHRYFVDFKSRIHVEISTSNRCHNLHVDSPFKIYVISTNFPRAISTLNRWRIDEDVPIGILWLANFNHANSILIHLVKMPESLAHVLIQGTFFMERINFK